MKAKEYKSKGKGKGKAKTKKAKTKKAGRMPHDKYKMWAIRFRIFAV